MLGQRQHVELLQSVAAEVITPRFRSLSSAQIDEKKPGDLVTVADHESEELITKALLDAYPDAVVLGEEAYAGDKDLLPRFRAAEHGFTVDPVDGTTAAAKALPAPVGRALADTVRAPAQARGAPAAPAAPADGARVALEATPSQLAVLHEAGVVEREEAGEDGLHLDLRWTARQKGAFEAFTGTATEADEDDEPEEPRSGGWHPAD